MFKFILLFITVFAFNASSFANYGDGEVTTSEPTEDEQTADFFGDDEVEITVYPEIQYAGPGGSTCKCSGVASYYALDGNKTANGEIFSSNAMTAASKCLPFGTKVKVCRKNDPSNCVTVRINDRGPFVGGRTLDLSKSAGFKIGLRGPGKAPVTCEIL